LPGPKTYEEAGAEWEKVGPKMMSTLPLNQLEELLEVAPYYYDWLKHPADDPWWDWSELRSKYGQVHAAVLNVSGWYDDNYGPEGATTNFSGLMKTRARQRDRRTHLLIGPWIHGVDATAHTRSGEREFSPAAAIDYDETVLRWMDHYLRGINNGVEKEHPVRYFVMGTNRWREAQKWPPLARATSYYLKSPAKGQPRGDLSTQAPKASKRSSSFVSDPAHPVTNPYDSAGAHDYRQLAKRDDVLIFDSAPLKRDTEVTGPIRARVFLSCDCRDTDLWVRLLDVAPDGAAFNLMSPGLDVLRASYRDLKRRRQLLTPGQVYELQLDNLITSNVFKKGHRIRVQISATFAPNFSRNLHTGDLEVSSARMQKANISIYTDRRHASRVILPIVAR
jgi:hypothetical protein